MSNEELAKRLTEEAIRTLEKTMVPVAWRARYINLDGVFTDWFYFDDRHEAEATASDDGELEELFLSPFSPKAK